MQNRRPVHIFITLFFLLWMAFVFASLYAIQKPFTPRLALTLGRTAWCVLVDIGIFSIALGVGNRLLAGLRAAALPPLERILFAAGLGWGALGVLIFLFEVLGLARPLPLALLFCAGLLFAGFEGIRLHRAGRLPIALSSITADMPHWLWPYLLGMGGISLLMALAPPLGWDSLFYHLTLPKLTLAAGRPPIQYAVPHFYFPGQAESLFTWGMALAGEGATAPLHLFGGALAGAAVFAIGRRLFSSRAAWYGLAMWASMPMVFVLGSWAYNDLWLAFYLAGALLAEMHWEAEGNSRWLLLAGAFLGGAMALKYTAGVGALALGLWVLWRAWRGRAAVRQVLRWVLALILPALLFAGPWYVRSLLVTGNPFYPFLFVGTGWDAFRAWWYGRPASGLGFAPLEWLKLPWTATVGIRDANYYDGQTGPMFLFLLPLALLVLLLPRHRRRLPHEAHPLLWVAGVLLAAWTAGVIDSRPLFQTRLLLPFFTLAAPFCGYLLGRLDELVPAGSISLRRLALAGLLLTFALNGIAWTMRLASVNPLPVLVGAESRQSFLERNLGAHAVAMREVNARLPEGSRVLFLWEPRTYYCDRPAQADAILDTWAHLVHRYGDADTIAGVLTEQGFTHILLYQHGLDFVLRTGMDPISPYALAQLHILLRDYAGPVPWPAEPTYALYALHATSPGEHLNGAH